MKKVHESQSLPAVGVFNQITFDKESTLFNLQISAKAFRREWRKQLETITRERQKKKFPFASQVFNGRKELCPLVVRRKQGLEIKKKMGQELVHKYWTAFLRILYGFWDVFIRGFFRVVYGAKGDKMPPIKNLLLLESASSLAFKIRTRKISSLEVVNAFIDRIQEINPILNCVVAERYAQARKEALAVDELLKGNTLTQDVLSKEKPFLGVPFTTKDCIAVKDMIHTSGLWRRREILASEDADSIASLRNAGAIPIALTNVSELCMWWESSNPVHGRTSNPYDTNHIVGGSSGGEGCIQGAAGSAFGIGSDIGGSIRMPAFFNGVFGHKPSKFVVSVKGQYPIPVNKAQESFLGIGPMTRRAEDLLPLLKIISRKNSIALKLDEAVDIKNVKFFYQETDMGSNFVSQVAPDIRELFKKVETHLEKAHKIKAKRVEIEKFRKSIGMWMAGMKTNSGPSFADQLANLDGTISVPFEFIKWAFRLSKHTFIGLVTALVERCGLEYGGGKYNHLMEECKTLRLELIDLLGDDGVFLYPTHPTAAPYHNEPIFKPFNFSYTGIINVLGFPATHIPMGLNKDGLPIGIQVVANDKNDRLCLAVAREFEKAFGGWVPPAIDA